VILLSVVCCRYGVLILWRHDVMLLMAALTSGGSAFRGYGNLGSQFLISVDLQLF
jgi:hypothetical protein